MNALKPWHIIVLLVVIILLFGANRLPDLARSLGQSLKIFKSEVKDLTADDKPAAPGTPTATQPPVQQPGTTGTDDASGAGSGTTPQA
ncbi:Sec-independent protein translocase subunit TatA [Cellulomonas soli]|uniref:Sec-independent protein translocase subunit TatA n=1 Tax=Cellulomonas soli TaxID=931535 RepID=UPI003F872E3A